MQTVSQPIRTLPTRTTVAQMRRWGIAFGLYSIASNLTFTQAVWVVYLAGQGYSPLAIGLFEMTFHVAKLVAEVPTGIFADLVGRRASLICSCLCLVVAEALFLPHTTPLLVLSFSFSGFSTAFQGGAREAIVWTLAERAGGADHAARYSRLFSRMLVVALLAEAAGAASGGYLSAVWLLLPFVARGLAGLVGIVPLLSLPERRAGSGARPRPLAHLRLGLGVAARDPLLLGLLLVSALEASIFTTTNYYTQLFFHGIGVSLVQIGLIVALTNLADFACTALAPRLMRWVPVQRLVPAQIMGVALGLLVMSTGQPVLGIAGFLLLVHGADSSLVPALSTWINSRLPEEQRATVLSLETGLFSAMMIVLFPLFGLGLGHITYSAAYLLAAGVLLVGCAAPIGWVALRRG